MQISIDNVTSYKQLKIRRDIVKLFYCYIDTIINQNAHATFVIQHDSDKGTTTIHWGTTK